MLCGPLIGRTGEVERLRARVDDLASGRGGLLVVVGDAGAGKSRLVDHVTASVDTHVLEGRAVPGGSPLPYRPLAEAFLSLSRSRSLPDHPLLRGFERQLGRLAPSWGDGTAAEDSPVLLAEAVVRLLGVLADARPAVLVLEDIHWSDPETLAVIDYLADALRQERTLCICTTRPTGAADDTVVRLARRDPHAVLPVDRLDGAEVARIVAACLDTTDPPAGLCEFVGLHSDGNPFLVEELLAGLVAVDALRNAGGHWEIARQLTPAVPASLRDSIHRRLDGLDPVARRVLGAAALLGRSFEWELLPGIADVDGRAAVEALRAAVTEQLIENDGDRFRFRHALTREAVLAYLLPPERRELGGRAWPAIERAKPGLPGPACELAADLAEAAGDPAAAAALLVESARRALANGAFASAEATARRARELAVDALATALDADEVLVDVLVAAGKPGDAIALGHGVDERLVGIDAPARRRADLQLVLARAALAAGDVGVAERAVDAARSIAADDNDGDRALAARIDTVATEVALDHGDLELGKQLGRRAVEAGRATDQPAVVCEALLLLGRLARPDGKPSALERFTQAAEVAAAAGLSRWQLRVQQELALELWEERGGAAIRETRDLAARIGAHLTVAVMDLTLADFALSDFETVACLEAATACADASRRYGLATESVAQLWLAGAHALADNQDAMSVAIDAALARDPHDPRILADLLGRVHVTHAFVRDELELLPGLLDEMMGHVRVASPTTSIYPGRVLWALLVTADGDDALGADARREYHEAVAGLGMPLFEHYGRIIDAVALGRSGAAAEADTMMRPAYDAVMNAPMSRGMARTTMLIVSRSAIRDGWGEPARWLRECDTWFAERGFDRLVRRTRALLRASGAPVSRRGRGDSEVPGALKALGITSREMDVLKLVAAGRSNKAIAAELYLSPKTVEHHLASLFTRVGVANRQALTELVAGHLA